MTDVRELKEDANIGVGVTNRHEGLSVLHDPASADRAPALGSSRCVCPSVISGASH